jgi:hypothetical protein
MALSPLNWRMLTPRNIPVGYTIANWLDLVYSLGTDTVYADGTARVPGTGSAWTWTRDQALSPGVTTACIGIPPINALNLSYIVAGDSVARAPVMNTDGWSTNAPLVSMNKNSGAYTSWVNAAPMTSGQFSGFIRGPTLSTFGSLAFPQTLTMFESQEGFLLCWNKTNAAFQSVLGGGALIDPLSAAAANAETDGRLYSICTSGANQSTGVAWLSTSVGILNSLVTVNDAHFFTFNVGAVATTRNTSKVGSFSSMTSSFLAPNGELPNIPLSAYFTTSGQFAGQYRQWGITRNGATGSEWSVLGVKKGYTLSYATQTTADALLLSY